MKFSIAVLVGGLLIRGVESSVVAQTAASPGADRPVTGVEYPVGGFFRFDQLPIGRFRSQLELLSPTAQERARSWLSSFHFTTGDLESLHADRSGGIFFACDWMPSALAGPVEAELPPVAGATLPILPFSDGLIFHSRPGAGKVLYLNFIGEDVVDTQWNVELSRAVIPAVPFSTDGDLTTFTDAEQAAIKKIWQRVSEDYAPFDIDVTTERPALFTTRTAMAVITRTSDANGELNPYSTAGGVSYVNVFGTSQYANYRPAWIYHNNLANTESYIAEATSHEIGHNLGLSHDGRTDGTEYYAGHGTGDISWGPLMGTGYNRNVTQWSNGGYYLANNSQDDLATIASKLAYRGDDHGGTPGTATILLITGGTNIVSTTPESDPENSNPANKGTLERNTDVDVFSFVTGSGPVSLTVSPWVMVSGTRGGNADLLAELYDSSGALVLTSDPALQTGAQLQTNLTEGRYYLQVRSAGAGDPFNSLPTGYTVYGSLGQYFVSGYISSVLSFNPAPIAELEVTDVTRSGQTNHIFTVTYSDDLAVESSTIDSQDVQVTGPNGYAQFAQLRTVTPSDNGTTLTATYAVTPPDGDTWRTEDNGTYVVEMEADEVKDTAGVTVTASELGRFEVAVPLTVYAAYMDTDPGWSLDPDWAYGTPRYPATGPSGAPILGYNLSGNYADRLSARYAVTPSMDFSGCTSLTLRFKRWLRIRPNDPVSIQVSTNRSTWLTVWSTAAAVSDSSWQTVQYPLPDDVADCSTVWIRWSLASNNSQSDLGWNLDDVEVLADSVADTSSPVPVLSVVNLTQGGSPSHACSVSYADSTAVRLASLDSTDLDVTSPEGVAVAVEFVGADLPADGAALTASYAVVAPGGMWDAADNGTYTVSLSGGAVEDTLGNATSPVVLGTFEVLIADTTPGVLAVLPSEGWSFTGTMGGPFDPGVGVCTLSNSGGATLEWTAGTTTRWLMLSETNGVLAAGATVILDVHLNPVAETFAAGSYTDTVSFVNASAGGEPVFRSVQLIVEPAVMRLAVSQADLSTVELRLTGPPFRAYALDVTSDFGQWEEVGTNAFDANGSSVYLDATINEQRARLYRARFLP